MSAPLRASDRLLLAALVAMASVWPLAAPPISTHGEAREGLVVQTIVHEGRWTLPLRNGEIPSKPPLYHWIAGAAAAMVGLSDAVVRLPSALAALLVLLLVQGLAGGRRAGWLAVAALVGMATFVGSASMARVDMLFTACVTATLAAFLRWYRDEAPWARVACYASAAAAVLTKGPAGAVLPALVIVAFLACERRLDRLRALWSWRLVAMVLVVDVGWYLLASIAGGSDFLRRQIFHENLDRFVGRGVFGLHGGRSRLAMVENLATDLLPWNLVLVWAALRWWRGEREDTIGRFLHAWWIVILLFFTVAYGKRGVYLLPLYPAIAVLAGRALAALVDRLTADPTVVPDAVRRFAPDPARALVLGLVVVDVAVLVIGQSVRVHKAGRSSLVPFARTVAAEVPPDARLVADASLDESDLLVLAYRLGRRLPRDATPPTCVAGTRRLLPATAAAGRAEPVVVSARRGVQVALVVDAPEKCPLALDTGEGR